jgi:hypothetical protein
MGSSQTVVSGSPHVERALTREATLEEMAAVAQSFHVNQGDLVEIQSNKRYGNSASTAPAKLLSFNVPPHEASATE